VSAAGDSIERAMAGSAAAPLTKSQRQRLMARYIVPAYARRQAAGMVGPSETLEAFRREEQYKACHKEHLTCCLQADYPLLVGHFLRLLDRPREAARWELKGLSGQPAVALRKLREACAEARDVIEDPAGYAAAICRAKFKTSDVASLGERQLWCLVFDVRRAAQKRRAHRREVAA